MPDYPTDPDGTPEVQHLTVEPYDDSERVEAPDWYDAEAGQ